ncbi:Bacterial mobilization protein (MobC) [compost metagenome]
MSRNFGGRPKILIGKRDKRIEIRLTEEEFYILQRLENETKLSRSLLFVNRILHQQDFFITNDVVNELSSIGQEIGRIGVNINQMAKHCNTVIKSQSLNPKITEEFNKLMQEFLSEEKEINKLFRQMYRTMAKPKGTKAVIQERNP